MLSRWQLVTTYFRVLQAQRSTVSSDPRRGKAHGRCSNRPRRKRHCRTHRVTQARTREDAAPINANGKPEERHQLQCCTWVCKFVCTSSQRELTRALCFSRSNAGDGCNGGRGQCGENGGHARPVDVWIQTEVAGDGLAEVLGPSSVHVGLEVLHRPVARSTWSLQLSSLNLRMEL